MQGSRNNRILYLLTHTNLREADVPMLLRLGFEVYVPKTVPSEEAYQRESVSYAHDSSLSISPDLLRRLNHSDLFNRPWSRSLVKDINANFGAAIATITPQVMRSLSDHFEGHSILRLFGLAGSLTYAQLFRDVLPGPTVDHIRRGRHVSLAASIPNIIDNEPQWIRKNAIYLPQGLPSSFYQHEHQWRGDQNKVFFVCPSIRSNRYHPDIYAEFTRLLGDLPHVIAGVQQVDVSDDPHGAGIRGQDEYVELFKSCKVMYYHSREERHLDFHPIEAMVYGMPVIFMSGGVLEFLAKAKLPGCCDTPEEARIKIKRILTGNEAFTREVIDSQGTLLKEFDTQYVEDCWRQRFLPLVGSDLIQASEVARGSNVSKELTHIGVWIHDTRAHGLTGEGISRLQAMIVRAAQARPDIRIHIASLPWVKDAAVDFMADLGVNPEQVSFITTARRSPLLYEVYDWWKKRRERPRRPWRPFGWIRRFARRAMAYPIAYLATVRGPGGWAAVVLVALLALPFLLAFALLLLPVGAFLLVRTVLQLVPKAFELLRLALLRNPIGSLLVTRLTLWAHVTKTRIVRPWQLMAREAYATMVESEFALLARKATADHQVEVWFFASPNNRHIQDVKVPVVVAVPDIVFLDFPTRYSNQEPQFVAEAAPAIESAVRRADAVITFSDYVRQRHVVGPGYQPEAMVRVIRHAPIDSAELISSRPDVNREELNLLARRIIKGYLAAEFRDPYLNGLNLGEIDYLFVSSQTRPHKNHLNLIKAYRILLRQNFFNLKLVFTGEFSPEIAAYIHDQRLNLDVLSMHYMPARVHAAFYACAKLVVAPTLFEGGFPFVFSEALSVGTPVMLSDIPVVRELLPMKIRKCVCFDPYDVDDMVARIAWALPNHQTLLNIENAIYAEMKKRTWEQVADEYLETIMSVGRQMAAEPQRSQHRMAPVTK